MTYDNAEEVRALAKRHGFQSKAVPMKNTHHAEMAELLIGRDLDWVESGGIFREEPPAYGSGQNTAPRKKASAHTKTKRVITR